MNPLKTILRPVAYTLVCLLGMTLSATAQDGWNYPYQQDLGSTVPWTQNQKNLDLAIGKALLADANQPIIGSAQAQRIIKNAVFQGLINDKGQWVTPIWPNDVVLGSANQATLAYQEFLNQLSPGLYTTLPTILFNSANIQNTQIQQRLWAVRVGRAQDDAVVPVADGGKNGKSVSVQDKKVVAPVAEPEKKWVTFVDGNGMWSQAQSVNNLPGYNTYAGGVQIGASYELLKGLSVGPYVGYQGTRVNFTGGNGGNSTATDNSVRYGLFGEYQKGGWYTDGIVGGAYNSVAVNHGIKVPGYGGPAINETAKGNVAGGEFDSLLGTGYEFKAGKLTFGPATSLQYTYLQLGGTQETGAGILNQNIGSQNASSMLYTLGGQASYTFDITQSVKLQPFASLAWQHEFLQNGYNVTSSILGQSYNYNTTNAGRDQYIAGIGGNLVLTKSLSAYAICNLINSDAQIFSQAVSGGINFKF
jgi:outer membrane autotransporter protein